MTLDPVQLALTQNRLDYITRQMGDVMVRTARSPIFSQAHDFTCFVCGPDGWLVSQADGIPIHSGGGGFAVRAVLRDFDEDIEPGDVFVLNDPWHAGGNHLPDWVVARPVFVDDRRIAFACNRAHQSDIGGGAPGTYNPLARDTWQEGVRLPAMKLVSRGEVRHDLWRLLLLNSRTPELQDGDLRAMLGATRIGAERVAEFAGEVSVEHALALFDGILDHAERRMRVAIAALPDGVYEGADHSDNDCFEPCDVAVRARLTIEGDSARVDLSGSSAQIRGFKNSTWANTCSSVYTAFASFFEPDIPRNEGTFRAIELIAPEGSIVNATEGAATTMCTVFVAHEIIHACWKALGAASPERACAGWAKNVFGITTGRYEDGRRYVLYHGLAAAGAGAVEGRDGFNQIGHLCTLGGLVMPSLEVYEQLYPVRYRRCEFRCDGGGPGYLARRHGRRVRDRRPHRGHLVVPGRGPALPQRLRRSVGPGRGRRGNARATHRCGRIRGPEVRPARARPCTTRRLFARRRRIRRPARARRRRRASRRARRRPVRRGRSGALRGGAVPRCPARRRRSDGATTYRSPAFRR